MRTCFRREQLRALEAYFAQKHNPDGKDWISLSSHTGLPKRVLQVWFQNARAKLRRSLSTDSTTHPEPMATVAMASSEDAINYQTSTIDQLELSLLTAPISESPTNHSVSHSFNHSDPVESYKNSAFLDYNTHNPLLLSSFGNIDLDPGVIME
ncbi:LIM/homeobox protein Lhx9-like [Hoplias malabaricus]|uniref:LIM/homeobox protein Lhx9-like n=1 Tax=Hoplias malabaricus TaxID=27720 RepID=UPI0034628608